MSEIAIPRYVDSQAQMFWWEVDELIPLVSMFGVGIMIGSIATMMIPAVGVSYLFSRFKSASLDGVLLHLGYWIGAVPLNRYFKNGAVRNFEV